jgi:hypothetical protein
MASASFLQRRMRIGFSRAAAVDMMERDGLLGPQQGSKPRSAGKPGYFENRPRAAGLTAMALERQPVRMVRLLRRPQDDDGSFDLEFGVASVRGPIRGDLTW